MKRYFVSLGDGYYPRRIQNLLISPSKRFYLSKSGTLKSQQKAIDPRLPGAKTLLVRLVLLDVDTGTLYGEMQRLDDQDVWGFLARAWSLKIDHPMRGIPEQLNIPKAVWADLSIREELTELSDAFDISIDDLPHGFSAGIHAVKNFENALGSLSRLRNDITLGDLQCTSGIISGLASSGDASMWNKDWYAIEGPDESFQTLIDKQYEPNGSWRMGPYARVLQG